MSNNWMSKKWALVGLFTLALAVVLYAWWRQYREDALREEYLAQCSENYRLAEIYSGTDARSHSERREQCMREFLRQSD